MKGKKMLALAAVTVTAAATMGVVYAAVGTQGDPLVTLSYLNDSFSASILSQVDARVEEQQSALKAQVDAQIQELAEELRSQMNQPGAPGGSQPAGEGSVYAVVTVPTGQTLLGDIGCEVMLRVGSAVCVSDNEPGLIDMTEGGTLSSESELVKNHLYMMTIDGRGVRAVTETKLLVRGTYVIQ